MIENRLKFSNNDYIPLKCLFCNFNNKEMKNLSNVQFKFIKDKNNKIVNEKVKKIGDNSKNYFLNIKRIQDLLLNFIPNLHNINNKKFKFLDDNLYKIHNNSIHELIKYSNLYNQEEEEKILDFITCIIPIPWVQSEQDKNKIYFNPLFDNIYENNINLLDDTLADYNKLDWNTLLIEKNPIGYFDTQDKYIINKNIMNPIINKLCKNCSNEIKTYSYINQKLDIAHNNTFTNIVPDLYFILLDSNPDNYKLLFYFKNNSYSSFELSLSFDPSQKTNMDLKFDNDSKLLERKINLEKKTKNKENKPDHDKFEISLKIVDNKFDLIIKANKLNSDLVYDYTYIIILNK